MDYLNRGWDKLLRKNIAQAVGQTEDLTSIRIEQVPIESVRAPIDKAQIQDAVSELIFMTSESSVSSSTVSDNSQIRLTSTLRDKSDISRMQFGIAEISAYMDSVALTNLVPTGSDAISAGHRVHTGYDLVDNEFFSNGYGRALTYIFQIHNESGSSHTYHWRVRWRYLGRPTAS